MLLQKFSFPVGVIWEYFVNKREDTKCCVTEKEKHTTGLFSKIFVTGYNIFTKIFHANAKMLILVSSLVQ